MEPKALAGAFMLAWMSMVMGCGAHQWEPRLLETGDAPPASKDLPYLKAHLQNGELAVFSSWRVPPPGGTELDGRGVRYSVEREPGTPGRITLPLDSVALLEANRQETTGRFGLTGLTVWTAVSTAVTVSCVADPKSCFGSCPTFYLEEEEGERLVAEGFSSSMARVFEARDIDALPEPARPGGDYTILMRNEAPETHAVRSLRLLAVPREPGREIYASTAGGFREGRGSTPVVRCTAGSPDAPEDCTSLVRAEDEEEYYSPADGRDLATREIVELEFPGSPDPSPGEEPGLVIRGRASLLSTYLFYQTIAYAGEGAGAMLAQLERGDAEMARRVRSLPETLGGVEILVEGGNGWETVGAFGEAGPIAADRQVVPLGQLPGGPLRVRLRMAKGAWRIDGVSLAKLGKVVEPITLDPVGVTPISGALPGPIALDRLLDSDLHLVTQRGEAYRIRFRIPESLADPALFLDSRGYYYEWMRGEWTGESNPAMAALILADPRAALRRMAPDFKAREAGMEETFWSSRFRRNER